MRVVLVCGGRDYCDRGHVFAVLDELHRQDPIARVLEGGATGADRSARRWASDRGVARVTYEARWGDDGRAAGPMRNQRMIDEGRPDLVVAFPGGVGTDDMVRRARATAGVGVVVVEAPNPGAGP